LTLAMHVPDAPDLARNRGLDVERWMREGWVDVIIGGNGGSQGADVRSQ